MRLKLAVNALVKFFCGLILVGLLLFLPAGSFSFLNGWLLIALLFIPMIFLGIFLLWKEPQLLAKRLDSKESESSQKLVVSLSGIVFIAGFTVAGLDFRFGWSQMPTALVWFGSALLLVSYALYAEVMRENAYLSRTVKVQEGQKVIDTGLYGSVRHPMYSTTLCLFLSFALVLGSFWALLCFLIFIPIFVLRIFGEEKLLSKELYGYEEYQKKVRFRLIPFVW